MLGSLFGHWVFFCFSLMILIFKLKYVSTFSQFPCVAPNKFKPNILKNLKLVIYYFPSPYPFCYLLALYPILTLVKLFSYSSPLYFQFTLLLFPPFYHLSHYKCFHIPTHLFLFLSYCVSFTLSLLYIIDETCEYFYYKAVLLDYVLLYSIKFKFFWYFLYFLLIPIKSFFSTSFLSHSSIIYNCLLFKVFLIFLHHSPALAFNSCLLLKYNILIHCTFYVVYILIPSGFSDLSNGIMYRDNMYPANTRPNFGKLIVTLLKYHCSCFFLSYI